MFSFLRKNRKDSQKKATEQNNVAKDRLINISGHDREICKNNSTTSTVQNPAIALECDDNPLPNYSLDSDLFQKNVPNATSVVNNLREKDDSNISLNPDILSTMCDKYSLFYVSGLKRTDPMAERKGTVKPCGHGTTAITPWVPPHSIGRDSRSPTPSPVLDVRKQFSSSNIENIEQTHKELKNSDSFIGPEGGTSTIVSSMKLHINIPEKILQNIEDEDM